MRILILNYHLHTHLGGSEIQCDILARHLIELGEEVIYGALEATNADFEGVRTDYPIVPVHRRFPRDFAEVLLEMEPDVVYWRAGRGGLFAASALSRAVGARFVFAIAAVTHTRPWTRALKPRGQTLRQRLKYGVLKYADLLRTRANFEGFRFVDALASNTRTLLPDVDPEDPFPPLRRAIYNAFEPVVEGSFQWPRPFIVWVANLKKNKNPDQYVELARRSQDLDVDFLMIGGIHHNEYDYVRDPDETPANFHYLGPRSPVEVNTILADSVALVHTCDPEGFSGNFIQAWWQGIPTLTLYHDPDGLIETTRCGRLSGSLDRLVEDVRDVVENEDLRRAMGTRARALAEEHFDAERNARRYQEFFEDVLSS